MLPGLAPHHQVQPLDHHREAHREVDVGPGYVDAEAVHRRLHGQGVEVGELLRWPGVPAMFAAHDADGNRFEVVERGEASG